MNKNKVGMICSMLLEPYPNINHGFGTRYENKELRNVITPHQVHGNNVAWIDGQGSYEADGLITNKKGVAIGVRTADCVPILLYEPVKRIIGVVHAGWKGTVAGIAIRAVDGMVNHGGSEEHLVAVIGPHIGPCCYRVNMARVDEIKRIDKRDGKTYVDLGETNKKQLMRAGVLSHHIEILPYCTHGQDDLFFSYRRNKTKERMVNYISLT